MLPKPHKSGGVDKLTPIPLKQEQKYSVTYRQCLCKTGTIQQCQTFITETCLCSVAQKPLIIPATNTPQLFVSFLFCFVLFVCLLQNHLRRHLVLLSSSSVFVACHQKTQDEVVGFLAIMLRLFASKVGRRSDEEACEESS